MSDIIRMNNDECLIYRIQRTVVDALIQSKSINGFIITLKSSRNLLIEFSGVISGDVLAVILAFDVSCLLLALKVLILGDGIVILSGMFI